MLTINYFTFINTFAMTPTFWSWTAIINPQFDKYHLFLLCFIITFTIRKECCFSSSAPNKDILFTRALAFRTNIIFYCNFYIAFIKGSFLFLHIYHFLNLYIYYIIFLIKNQNRAFFQNLGKCPIYF